MVVRVVVESAILTDFAIVVFIICVVSAVGVIFIIRVIGVKTGIVICSAGAIIGCIGKLWWFVVEGKGKQGC